MGLWTRTGGALFPESPRLGCSRKLRARADGTTEPGTQTRPRLGRLRTAALPAGESRCPGRETAAGEPGPVCGEEPAAEQRGECGSAWTLRRGRWQAPREAEALQGCWASAAREGRSAGSAGFGEERPQCLENKKDVHLSLDNPNSTNALEQQKQDWLTVRLAVNLS